MKRQAPCEPSDESQQARKRGPSSRPPRASQACRSCAASKVRCDDLEICRRCLKRGVPCIRPTPVGQGYRSAMGEAPCVLSNLSHSQQCSDTQTMDNLGDILLTDTTEWFKNLSFHAEFDTSFLLPLPFIDLSGYPDEILIENPTDLTTMSSESMLPQEKTIFDEAVIAHSSTLGSWKPTHEDYLGAARASLYVPLDEQVLLEEGLGHLNSTVIGGCLSSARRDEIIVAMIDGTQTAQTLLAVRMFPSVEILDRFLKIFLTSQETSALAFVHIPTFDPSTCSLSLLMACIVAGATLSPIASARKFGLGLFDVLRLYLAASAEKQNTLTRDLSYVQSLMILSETGLWSGDKRISEISDFLSELTANMLRHAGRFVQHSYLNPILMLEGPLGELDAVWIRWAQQESLKRFSTPPTMYTAIRFKEYANTDVTIRGLDAHPRRLSFLVCQVSS
ncbi:unnamed protein product [Fusarium graminearum]|uniref:Chromosome 3, complete genome n=2 Tax=Gibberella zeae (strain ATCC MYA-4620 / CBS 123657 / FGSC 9075 / NRRL 31084 / PH-1) TaxID=229533 RepID=A0A1C3YJV0_GIBZE|nr:unnamed protein product [Fusarium graminearum]